MRLAVYPPPYVKVLLVKSILIVNVQFGKIWRKWNPENWIQFLVLWVNTYQIAHLWTLPPPRSYIYTSKRNWCLGGIHLPRWRNGHVTLTRFSFGEWFKIFIKFIFNKYIFAHVSLPVEKEILIVNVQFGKYSLIKPKIVSNFLEFASNLVGELITELPRPEGLRVIPAEFPQFLDLTCFKQLPCIWTQTAEQIDFKFDRSTHYSALQAWSTFGNVLMNCSSDFSPLWFTPQWGHASTYALFLMPQVPFAWYVARNNIQHIKRYNIERVFQQKKMLGLHPRELTECAFDIITAVPVSLSVM